MYGVAELREDSAGYGQSLYIAQGPVIVERHPTYTPAGPHPLFRPEHANFLHKLYAFVRTSRVITIYRAYGEDSTASARLLGRYWTPKRPSLAIDRLGYESSHTQVRQGTSVIPPWNAMTDAAEADLAPGAEIFVGRAAPQTHGGKRYAGGDIQFFLNLRGPDGPFVTGLPRIGHQLHIRRGHTLR